MTNSNERATELVRANTRALVLSVVFLSIATLAPLLKVQAITGVVVNAILFLSVLYLGWRWAILIALVPSAISIGVGLLPIAFGPMVPFIMLGNIVLIVIFSVFKAKNFGWAMIGASVLKFVFLYVASHYVVSFFVKKAILAKLLIMMSWPQLYTAILGGILAYVIYQFIKVKFKNVSLREIPSTQRRGTK